MANTKEAESVHWLLGMSQTELAYLGGELMTLLQEMLFSLSWGKGVISEFLSFKTLLQLFLQKTSLTVNKLVPVLARKCFILSYIYG